MKLVITSEDTIHSFFVPAFRIKKDAVPGRYNMAWFRATKTGTYHLFCAEYCGTEHSKMIGRVVVMEPEAYQTWLAGGPPPESPVAAGEKLFTELNCITCHRAGQRRPRPACSQGIFGRPVKLASGDTVVADEAYVRESIVNPAAKVVAGYQPVMPTYQGQVSEEQLIALIAYIQSLQVPARGRARRRTARAPRNEAEPKPMSTERPALPKEHYLSGGWDLKSWLLTTDHKRIGILYLVSITADVRAGQLLRGPRPLEPAGPRRQPHVRRRLQQDLHRPRRDHGLLLPDPVDPGHPRELPHPADDRGARTWPSRSSTCSAGTST